MQIVGFVLLVLVIIFGFSDRGSMELTAFDLHAFVIALGGSAAAVLSSSSAQTVWRTLQCVREIIPGLGTLRGETQALEADRQGLVNQWKEGSRAQAVASAEASPFPAIQSMLKLTVARAPRDDVSARFMELRHDELRRYQPAIASWELLAKLAPSFGMVGTITGMIQMFRTMGDRLDIGAAMSMALLSTFYGVAFGAGVAGPIGHYLRNLLDERLGALDRAEQSVLGLVARSDGAGGSS